MIRYNNLSVLYMDDANAYLDLNKDYILEYLKDNDIDATPNNIEDATLQLIDDDRLYLVDLIKDFDKNNDCEIEVIANLGLWYGRRKAKARFKSLFNAFYKCIEDINILYFKNANATLTLGASHHDGDNFFKFYKIKKGKRYAIKQSDILR